MMMKRNFATGLTLLSLLALPAYAEDAEARLDSETSYVYVAPNIVHARAHDIFTTLALTNTSIYWFNPRIYLIDADGEIVREFAPLLKGFGTWQKTSVDFLPEDFQGSAWIVSAQPIVATAFIHQLKADGSLVMLGSFALERMDREAAEALRQHASSWR
jgi:hypothetical protein